MTYTSQSSIRQTDSPYTAEQLVAAFQPITPPDQYQRMRAAVHLCDSCGTCSTFCPVCSGTGGKD